MCGIVGAAGSLTFETDKMFKNLLIVDSLRGLDSTGIAAINRDEEIRVVKAVGNPFDLMNLKSFDQALGKMNRAIIGHNRFATQGVVNRRNAHPFEFEHIVGVHNGTLQSKHKLLDANQFTVDSENLYHHMNEKGLESLLEVIEGAWSLVWWDRRDSTLNFLRNKERPMWIVPNKKGDVILWASEPWMLDAAIQRSPMDFEEPVSTKVDQHYSFHIDDKAVLNKPVCRPAEAKTIPYVHVFQQHGGYQRNFQHGQGATSGNSTALSVVKPDNVSITPTGKVVVFSKKNRVIPTSIKRLATDSQNLYEGLKDVLLEPLAKHTDEFGADYLICFDPKNPRCSIRLYIKPTDNIGTMINNEILCTVGSKFATEKGIYYKVVHGSVKLANRNISIGEPEEGEEEQVDHAGKYFADSRGNLLPVRDWENKYHQCSWCTSSVFGSEPNRFTDSGDILCPTCASDEEVHQYVKVM